MSKNHEADLKCHLRWQLSLAWSQSQSSLQTNTVDTVIKLSKVRLELYRRISV